MRSHLQLADNRQLHFEVSGPADGLPFVWQHGTPGSVVQRREYAAATAERGLRLVTFSRPGYGDSSRRPGRSVADVAVDIAALLDALDAPVCLTGGGSGGGPHALATAAALPERVLAALAVCCPAPRDADGLDFLAGMGEQNVEELGLAAQGEEGLRPYLVTAAAEFAGITPQGIVASLSTLLPDVDRAVITDRLGEDLVASLEESVRTGVDGWVDDDLALVGRWGFELAELSVPVSLWHGDLDLMVPFAHGQWMAAHVPGVVPHLLPGQGHLSISTGAFGEMLDELLSLAGR